MALIRFCWYRFDDFITLGKPRKITEPEKELRFTRARQALTFVAFGGTFLCITFWMWLSNTTLKGQAINEVSIRFIITIILFCLSLICIWVAVNCVRHAFIILTPLGIELFPFWLPSKNLQVIYWTEIDNAIVTEDMKTLEIQCQGGGKVFVALAPISVDRLPYLKRAIEGRMDQAKEPKDKKEGSEDPQQ